MEDETQETKQTQETLETQETQGTLKTLEAELQQERQAKAAAEAALAEKDNRIAELEASLSEAKQAVESLRAEGVAISQDRNQAVSKYLDAIRAANPTIPQDIITGDTIEEIDAALEKATTIAESVKASLEAQAKETRVPAGAPPRMEISVEGLSPREKIAAGIQQKQGGTQ
jgi:chromosome segregation ATPase